MARSLRVTDWPHWIALPVMLPLFAAALMLPLERLRPRWVPALSLLSTLALLAIALRFVWQQQAGGAPVEAYLVGNWRAPYGIALALDRLSALMLLLTALVALASCVYALAGDAARGLHFHALFQLQLMGLNGAFLTADLFNLFVFFEVLLAASYALLLHGDATGRRARLKAAIHYVSFNLAGSALFLIAVALLYGLTGTLNLADLARELPLLGAADAALAQAAALLLLTVFAIKAALLPLYFWLPEAYAAATAPVAALFALLTKVGVYAILRTTTLVFGADGGAVALVAMPALPLLALATLALGAIGALAATRLRGLVGYLVVGSAGTLLLAVGLHRHDTVAAGLVYLVNSTLAAAAWFLIADRIAAARALGDALRPAPLRGDSRALGAAFFTAAIAMVGLPPLSGFLAKAMLLQAAGATEWATSVVVVVLFSSLALLVALARAGALLLWEGGVAAPTSTTAPARPVQALAIALALAAVIGVAVGAGPMTAYAAATADQLFDRRAYIAAVLGRTPVAPAFDVRREMRERGELPR
ncbi:MAG: monovalent cation/H+ antiporter subunit D [Ideonella sp.]|nr:monovalent cation/H+ antiporter subunit D [Ideonella sp.]